MSSLTDNRDSNKSGVGCNNKGEVTKLKFYVASKIAFMLDDKAE